MDNEFVPLTTTQGLTITQLKKIVGSKSVIIWGAGHLGKVIRVSLRRYGLLISAFCDGNIALQGSYIKDTEIISPAVAITRAKKGKSIIVIASIQHRDAIQKQCESHGLYLKVNYLLYLHISRPESVIDISGKCNITCPSCPRGNMSQFLNEGLMSLDDFNKVFIKLLSEVPLLSLINLSGWGEPLLNPDLPKIIKMTEEKVPCTLSTNLQNINFLEETIYAQPSQFVISISGFGAHYENMHLGAKWQVLIKNLFFLKKLIKKIKPSTEFRVLYHLYKNNQGEDLEKIKKLCSDLKIKLVTTVAYLNPYEQTLSYCKEEGLNNKVQQTMNELAWDIDLALKLSLQDRKLPCLCQRIFPIINWNLSVSLCHIYYGPIIAQNFLNINYKDLLTLRHNQSQCRTCQSHSLHRLDFDILQRRYPKEKLLLSRGK
jgi:wyosine [tRNA(Phe)-imidazoG37] synthetase (radical SAM superfamily)